MNIENHVYQSLLLLMFHKHFSKRTFSKKYLKEQFTKTEIHLSTEKIIKI